MDLDPSRFHLALVGRISEEKNHRLFLEALSLLDAAERGRLCTWFVGAEDGAPRFIESIRRELNERGLADSVRMVPPTRELPALMARLDGLVLPSRYEGFPNVVLEAMASRLPVVASSVGDVPSLVQDGRTGFVVPAGDVGALARSLSQLLSLAPEVRAEFGRAGRDEVEAHYRIETVAQGHLDLYRRLARQHGDAAPRGRH